MEFAPGTSLLSKVKIARLLGGKFLSSNGQSASNTLCCALYLVFFEKMADRLWLHLDTFVRPTLPS